MEGRLILLFLTSSGLLLVQGQSQNSQILEPSDTKIQFFNNLNKNSVAVEEDDLETTTFSTTMSSNTTFNFPPLHNTTFHFPSLHNR